MTVQYLGMGEYKIFLPDKSIILRAEEIQSITDYAIENSDENDFNTVFSSKLSELDEMYQKEIKSLSELLRDYKEEVDKLENMLL